MGASGAKSRDVKDVRNEFEIACQDIVVAINVNQNDVAVRNIRALGVPEGSLAAREATLLRPIFRSSLHKNAVEPLKALLESKRHFFKDWTSPVYSVLEALFQTPGDSTLAMMKVLKECGYVATAYEKERCWSWMRLPYSLTDWEEKNWLELGQRIDFLVNEFEIPLRLDAPTFQFSGSSSLSKLTPVEGYLQIIRCQSLALCKGLVQYDCDAAFDIVIAQKSLTTAYVPNFLDDIDFSIAKYPQCLRKLFQHYKKTPVTVLAEKVVAKLLETTFDFRPSGNTLLHVAALAANETLLNDLLLLEEQKKLVRRRNQLGQTVLGTCSLIEDLYTALLPVLYPLIYEPSLDYEEPENFEVSLASSPSESKVSPESPRSASSTPRNRKSKKEKKEKKSKKEKKEKPELEPPLLPLVDRLSILPAFTILSRISRSLLDIFVASFVVRNLSLCITSKNMLFFGTFLVKIEGISFFRSYRRKLSATLRAR